MIERQPRYFRVMGLPYLTGAGPPAGKPRFTVMKKLFRSSFLLMAALLVCSALCSCAPYTSSYRAVGFVHSNTANEAFMSFFEFEGRMVFKLSVKRGEKIECEGRLGSGSASVRAAVNGREALELLTLGAERPEDHCLFEPNDTGVVWIVMETAEKCENGSFTFTVVHE